MKLTHEELIILIIITENELRLRKGEKKLETIKTKLYLQLANLIKKEEKKNEDNKTRI